MIPADEFEKMIAHEKEPEIEVILWSLNLIYRAFANI
jgi:hypothetical protein